MRLPLFVLWAALGLSSPALAGTAVPTVDPVVRTGEKAPKDVALVVGNEAYTSLPQFVRGGEDARSFRDWLLLSRGVTKGRVVSLGNVGREAMLKEAKKIATKVKKGGTVWIYYAGHGAVTDDGRRLLLGVDAGAGNLTSRGLRLDELIDVFTRPMKADRVIVVLDAGFGNAGRDGLELIPGRDTKVPDGFTLPSERVAVWAAARDDAPSWSFDPGRHGLFTWSALGALRGWVDGELDGQPDGRVTSEEAQAYTARLGVSVGRAAHPTEDRRLEPQGWVLAQGKGLERGPDAATLATVAREDIAARMKESEERLRAEAAAFWKDTLNLARQGGPAGEEALMAYIGEFSRATATLSWAVPIAEVQDARRLLSRYGEADATEAVAKAAVSSGEELATCDSLPQLEVGAASGGLSAGVVRCLEGRLKTERLQTNKNKLSRLLMANAEAAGDTTSWERLIARHLDEIDRSDPNLCLRYSVFLHKTGDPENAEEAIRWADYSLENKQVWEGDEYVKRVNAIYRLRAEAAQRLWQDAEDRYRREPTPEIDAQTLEYRGLSKDYAREWLDYARAARQPTDTAYNLCTSAAGTTSFCQEEPKGHP